MILESPEDAEFGVLSDTDRRDKLFGAEGADVFELSNDGRTDSIFGFEDGVDTIDISAFDAHPDALQVKQLSLTEYVVDFQGEERIRITFEEPAPADVPDDGVLLDADDFIFATGVPAPTTQMIFERSATQQEVHFGTTRPDIFVFDYDGERDTVRRFEPGKDQIDLSGYGVGFGDLEVTERKVGRISIKIHLPEDGGVSGTDPVPPGSPPDWLVVIDVSHQLTAGDITADMFIF